MPDVDSGDATPDAHWVDVGPVKDVSKKRSVVVDGDREEVAVFWNGDAPCAFANTCVHRDRPIDRSAIFKGRLICPGHQWAFALDTGHCAEKDRVQPVYRTRVNDDRVEVDVSAPSNAAAVAADAAAAAAATELAKAKLLAAADEAAGAPADDSPS